MTDAFGSSLEQPLAFTRDAALDWLSRWTTLETVFFPTELHCIALRVTPPSLPQHVETTTETEHFRTAEHERLCEPRAVVTPKTTQTTQKGRQSKGKGSHKAGKCKDHRTI